MTPLSMAVAFAIALTSSAALAQLAAPPFPSMALTECTAVAASIKFAKENPYSAPASVRGTPFEAPDKLRTEIERAERRRVFARDCVKLGYRLPNSDADVAHNQALSEKQSKEAMRQFEAWSDWLQKRGRVPHPQSGVPPTEPGPEETAMVSCSGSWLFSMSVPRDAREASSACRAYGFEDARDPAGDARNRVRWEKLNDRIAEVRTQRMERSARVMLGE